MPKTEQTLGTVVNIDDPAKAGRIMVNIESMDGQAFPEWIEPEFPAGMVVMPEVGDIVALTMPEGEDIIEFAEEVRYTGVVLNESNPVPDEFKPDYPKRRGWKTKSGHLIILSDVDGQEEIQISHKGVLMVVLNNSGIFLGTTSATEKLPLGDLLMASLSVVTGALLSHTHTGVTPGVGLSGVADPASITTWTTEKGKMDTGALLSDFIFAQKTKPT